MKICTNCNRKKDETLFHKSSRFASGLQSWCKQCAKKVNTAYYKNNKAKVIEQKRLNKEQRVQRFEEWKSTLCCSACGENDSCCLDFHHRNPLEKDGSISDMVYSRNCSFQRVLNEVAKCVILCANCHRKGHKHSYLVLCSGERLEFNCGIEE